MLSMKTLRVAIVTMGSVLLLGSGLPMAQGNTINLNGTGDDAPTPLVYAQETLPSADPKGRRALDLDGAMDVAVKPRRTISLKTEDLYLRIDLSGAQFGATPTLVSGAATNGLASLLGILSSGGADSTFAVLKIEGGDPDDAVSSTDLLGVRIETLQVTTTTGNVTATISAYTNPDDALDQVGSRSTFGGSGTIIRFVSGLKVTIKAAAKAVASVDTGFVRFVGPSETNGTAKLGWLGVEENTTSEAGAALVRNAVGGKQIIRGDILEIDENDAAVGKVSFNVVGNLDIGAFSVQLDDSAAPAATCVGGTTDTVDRGDLVGADNKPLIGKEGELPSGVESASTGLRNPDVYLLCLNVDVTGPMSNMMPIPEGPYTATAYIKRDAGANTPTQKVGEGAPLAAIDRDGASVNISYLTTFEQHNQRLIIVNRGNRPIVITDIAFQTEGKTEAHLSEALSDLDEIESGVTVMHKVSDILSITGDSRRTAATLSFNGVAGNISVATTQVNLGDSSTDTVVWPVE